MIRISFYEVIDNHTAGVKVYNNLTLWPVI